ncbi:MAG: carbohydrate kinase family protein [Flavobacteriales bacterium]
MIQYFICFGEVLWDMLPSGKVAGGAPMNVAFRLKELQNDVRLFTAIGKDELGTELLEILKGMQLSKDVHSSEYLPTGTVAVELSEAGNASYSIAEGVAWDEIPVKEMATQSFQLIFGSLALRSEKNQATILKLIDLATEVVFDINLRAPFYSWELIDQFIQKAHLIKMNEDEFDWICDQMHIQEKNAKSRLSHIDQCYPHKIWCITKGANGAAYFEHGIFYEQTGFPTKVVDTIGAGDAFLAGLLHRRQQKASPQDFLRFACKIGSIVAGQKGASQAFDPGQIVY